MFDALIREAAEKFGLGNNGKLLVAALVAAIFNHRSGGFAGFQSRFHDAGLGPQLQSWIGGSPGDNALQPDQFSAGFGDGLVGSIAGRLGVQRSAVTLAGAALLPRLVALLTRNGIPHAAPPEAASLISAWEAGPATTPRAPEPVKSGGGWWKWLLLLAALVLAFLLFRGCKREEAVVPPPPTTPEATTPAPAPVAQANPRFSFDNTGGKVAIGGQLPSDVEKNRLLEVLRSSFGAENISGDIGVDAATAPPRWLDPLIALLPDLKAQGLKFAFDGDKLTIDTSGLPEDQRFAISQRVRQAFADFDIVGLWDRAAAALTGLKAGFSGGDLVEALNLTEVYFATGSATITRDSAETLQQAATAIKAAPAGTRIEVGGHTDNTGDAALNTTLSQERANAVMARLVELGVAADSLTGKGYGQDKPVADNATEEGRAENRRIEFTVLP